MSSWIYFGVSGLCGKLFRYKGQKLKSFKSCTGILLYVLIVLLCLEAVCRIFLWFNVKVFNTQNMIYTYYPQMHMLDDKQHDPNSYDILILGASSVAATWSNGGVQTVLGNRLSQDSKRNIRIFNLAVPAHSLLDSYYEYKQLINRKFDLVLIYQGINETRANNCPSDIFQSDYSHYSW